MSSVSQYFVSLGIDPFLGGLIAGVVLCALARVSWAKARDENDAPVRTHVSYTEIKVGDDVSKAVLAHLARGEKIEAIKLLRESSGMDLRQAKQMVDALDAARPK